MTQKQSILNILVGSILLTLANTVIFNMLEKNQMYEAAAGFFVTAFVVLLFLTSFVPAWKQKQHSAGRYQEANSRGRRSAHNYRNRSDRDNGGSRQDYQQGREGGGSRVNYRDRRARKRDYPRHTDNKQGSSYAPGLVDQPPVEDDLPDDIGNTNRLTGKVKYYDKRKGFGFLVFEGEDVFFHRNSLKSPAFMIKEDAPVEFVIGDSPKGQQALNVRALD